jgi:phage tail-like protein
MVERLPSLYQSDDLTRRFTAGLDEVLAPVLSTLDNLWAYFDPRLCPPDLLAWLATWVGAVLTDDLPEAAARELVATAATWQRGLGTAAALAEQVRQVAGGAVEVVDPGATTWSTTPGQPGQPEPDGCGLLRVVVRGARSGVERDRVVEVVRAAVPAHLPVEVELGTVTDGGGT